MSCARSRNSMVGGGKFTVVTLFALLVACGSQQTKKATPPRIKTGSEKLLALVPATADAVFEVEVGRLRENEVVGPLVTAVLGRPSTVSGTNTLGNADRLVICSFGIGDRVDQLVLIEQAGGAIGKIGTALEPGISALGPPSLIDRVREVKAGKSVAISEDEGFLRLRDASMPKKANAAGIRATARLSFDARVALARALDIDAVPTSFSVWADVLDDAAMVALLAAEDEPAARRLAKATDRLRDRLRSSHLARFGIGTELLEGAKVSAEGRVAKVVWVLGPQRLSKIVGRLMKNFVRTNEDSS